MTTSDMPTNAPRSITEPTIVNSPNDYWRGFEDCRKQLERELYAMRHERDAAAVAVQEAAARACEKRAHERFFEHGTTELDTNAQYYEGKAKEIYESMDEEDSDCAFAIRNLNLDALKAGRELLEPLRRALQAAQEIRLDFAALPLEQQALWSHLPEFRNAIDAAIAAGEKT